MEEYKMYIWESGLLANWSSGLAVAVATSAEEARKILIKEYMKGERIGKQRAKAYRPDRYGAHWGIAADIQGKPDRVLRLPCGAYIEGGG